MSRAASAGGGGKKSEAHLAPNARTRRDLFGRVRGRCGRCACDGYEKDTGEYDAVKAGVHPHCDVTLTNCSRCGCASSEHEVDECADWRERGNDAYEREAYEEAVRCFTRAIDAGPGDARSFSNRSACFMKMKRYSQALSDAERAVILDGNWAKARSRVGAAALAMGRFDLAERAFGLALKLDPASQTARQGLSELKDTVARAERSRASSAPTKSARRVAEPPSAAAVQPSARRDALVHEARSLLDRLEEILSIVRSDLEKPATAPEITSRVDAGCQTTESTVCAETFTRDVFGVGAEPLHTNNGVNRFVVPQADGDDGDGDADEDDVESSLMARLLRVASGEDVDKEDTSTTNETNETNETLITDTLKFFEEFQREAGSSDDENGEVDVRAETAQDDDKWAERWEAEQFTAREQKAEREKILLEHVQKRQSAGSRLPRPPGLKSDSLADLFKARERSSMGDMDAEGAPRGPCRACGEVCASFARLSTWKRPPLPTMDPQSPQFASLYQSLVLGLDGARCARCGCESSSHCTEKEFRKRERLDRVKEAKKQSEESDRNARVRIAAERVQKARDQFETVVEMTCDAVLSAERRECTKCADCPGFRLIFPQSQATVPEVVCFCSMCGCRANDHVVCERWSRERDASRERFERQTQAQQERRAAMDARNVSTSLAQHYETLGVSSRATRREISKAYRRAALRWHPDKHSHKVESERRKATNMFIRVADAFKALCGDRPT